MDASVKDASTKLINVETFLNFKIINILFLAIWSESGTFITRSRMLHAVVLKDSNPCLLPNATVGKH